MLLQKRALRVQSARCSRLTKSKLDDAPTSREYFQLDVPKWSNYFPPPSDEKKICKLKCLSILHSGNIDYKMCG